MKLNFQENGFLIKNLSARKEMEAAMRLRHEVFCGELKWVPPFPDGLEKDRYDEFSDHLGVFDEDETLIGHLRLTPAPHPFMIEKEFACLMPENTGILKGYNSSEVTRLCVRKDSRLSHESSSIPAFLYKGMYQWSLLNEKRYSYMVVDYRCFRHLRLIGLNVENVFDFKIMPDGVKAAVCVIDWRAFEKISAERKPEYFEWMSTAQVPYPSRSLSHGLY